MSAYDSYESQLDPAPKVRKRLGPFGSESLKTVAEALAFCDTNGLNPAEVRLAHNYVTWETPETVEEVNARIERAKSDRQRHLDRIREMHDEYVERGLYDAAERGR